MRPLAGRPVSHFSINLQYFHCTFLVLSRLTWNHNGGATKKTHRVPDLPDGNPKKAGQAGSIVEDNRFAFPGQREPLLRHSVQYVSTYGALTLTATWCNVKAGIGGGAEEQRNGRIPAMKRSRSWEILCEQQCSQSYVQQDVMFVSYYILEDDFVIDVYQWSR